jgi:hypothetical protein
MLSAKVTRYCVMYFDIGSYHVETFVRKCWLSWRKIVVLLVSVTVSEKFLI